MNTREMLFLAIKLEMETQKTFFDLCDRVEGDESENECELTYNHNKCHFSGYIATKDDGNELKKASYEIFCENMNTELSRYRKKFGYRPKVRFKSESGMLVCKVDIKRA